MTTFDGRHPSRISLKPLMEQRRFCHPPSYAWNAWKRILGNEQRIWRSELWPPSCWERGVTRVSSDGGRRAMKSYDIYRSFLWLFRCSRILAFGDGWIDGLCKKNFPSVYDMLTQCAIGFLRKYRILICTLAKAVSDPGLWRACQLEVLLF